MYLSWLTKWVHSVTCIFFFKKIAKATVSKYIITWKNVLYFPLGLIPIWPTSEQINEEIPTIFNMPLYVMHIRFHRTLLSTTVLPFHSKLVILALHVKSCHI